MRPANAGGRATGIAAKGEDSQQSVAGSMWDVILQQERDDAMVAANETDEDAVTLCMHAQERRLSLYEKQLDQLLSSLLLSPSAASLSEDEQFFCPQQEQHEPQLEHQQPRSSYRQYLSPQLGVDSVCMQQPSTERRGTEHVYDIHSFGDMPRHPTRYSTGSLEPQKSSSRTSRNNLVSHWGRGYPVLNVQPEQPERERQQHQMNSSILYQTFADTDCFYAPKQHNQWMWREQQMLGRLLEAFDDAEGERQRVLQREAQRVAERLQRLQQQADRRAAVALQLESEKHLMEEARDIVAALLQLRVLKGTPHDVISSTACETIDAEKLAAAVAHDDMLSAAAAITQLQQIRVFFAAYDTSLYTAAGTRTESAPLSLSYANNATTAAAIIPSQMHASTTTTTLTTARVIPAAAAHSNRFDPGTCGDSSSSSGSSDQMHYGDDIAPVRLSVVEKAVWQGIEQLQHQVVLRLKDRLRAAVSGLAVDGQRGGTSTPPRHLQEGKDVRNKDEDKEEEKQRYIYQANKKVLYTTFSLLTALCMQEEGLRVCVQQLKQQRADDSAKRFKVLLQAKKQQKPELTLTTANAAAAGEWEAPQRMLHAAALARLDDATATMMKLQVKALRIAAALPPPNIRTDANTSAAVPGNSGSSYCASHTTNSHTSSSINSSSVYSRNALHSRSSSGNSCYGDHSSSSKYCGDYRSSSSGGGSSGGGSSEMKNRHTHPEEGAAAVVYALVSLRQEVDVEGVRLLNHFVECRKDLLTMKPEDKCDPSDFRRLDCTLAEIAVVSKLCLQLHWRFVTAATHARKPLLRLLRNVRASLHRSPRTIITSHSPAPPQQLLLRPGLVHGIRDTTTTTAAAAGGGGGKTVSVAAHHSLPPPPPGAAAASSSASAPTTITTTAPTFAAAVSTGSGSTSSHMIAKYAAATARPTAAAGAAAAGAAAAAAAAAGNTGTATRTTRGAGHTAAIYKKTGVNAAAEEKQVGSLVDFVRRCGALDACTFESSPLLKRREELAAQYVSLENTFVTTSLDQALNVADELNMIDAPPYVGGGSMQHQQHQQPQQLAQGYGYSSGVLGAPADFFFGGGEDGNEEEEEEDDRLYSTLVDDLFFILNKSVLRAIDTADVLAACAVVNNVCNALGSSVKQKLRRNLEESKHYYADYVRSENRVRYYSLRESLQAAAAQCQGAPLPERPGSSYSWPHSVNNVSLAVQTLKKFKARVDIAFDRMLEEQQQQQQMGKRIVKSRRRRRRRRRNNQRKKRDDTDHEAAAVTTEATDSGGSSSASGSDLTDDSNEDTNSSDEDDEQEEEEEEEETETDEEEEQEEGENGSRNEKEAELQRESEHDLSTCSAAQKEEYHIRAIKSAQGGKETRAAASATEEQEEEEAIVALEGTHATAIAAPAAGVAGVVFGSENIGEERLNRRRKRNNNNSSSHSEKEKEAEKEENEQRATVGHTRGMGGGRRSLHSAGADRNNRGTSSSSSNRRHPKAGNRDTNNDRIMFGYTLQAVDGIVEELHNLHERCCRVTVRLLQSHLHRGMDALHEAVYEVYSPSGAGAAAAAVPPPATIGGGADIDHQQPLTMMASSSSEQYISNGSTASGAAPAFASIISAATAASPTRVFLGGVGGGGGVSSEPGMGEAQQRQQERWRLLLQRGIALVLNHVGRIYDRATQALTCNLLLQLVATKIETLLLDKNYTALGGLQLSGQLRRLLQQLSLLHHHHHSTTLYTSPSAYHPQQGPSGPMSSQKLNYLSSPHMSSGGIAASTRLPGAGGHTGLSTASVVAGAAAGGGAAAAAVVDAGSSLLEAIAAAAAAGGASSSSNTTTIDGISMEEIEGEQALKHVRIFCDTAIRPKFGRLLEIGELLSLWTLDELADIWVVFYCSDAPAGPASGKFWRLTDEEVKRVLERRVEFTQEDIEAFFKKHSMQQSDAVQ